MSDPHHTDPTMKEPMTPAGSAGSAVPPTATNPAMSGNATAPGAAASPAGTSPAGGGGSRTDRLKAKAGDVAHQAADKARDLASDAGHRLQEEFKEQWHRVRTEGLGIQGPEVLHPTVAAAAAANARRTEANLAYYRENPAMIARRLAELDDEWDTRRVLQVATSGLSLAGFWFSFTKSRLWTLLPIAMAGGALHQGLTGASPAEDVVRRLGFRTRDEIEFEKRALANLDAGNALAVGPGDLTAPQMG